MNTGTTKDWFQSRAMHMHIWTLTLAIHLAASSTLFYSIESQLEAFQVKEERVKEREVYLFAVDGKRRPYSYINEEGTLTGFEIDFINQVCSVAGKLCYTILAEYQECIFTDRSLDYAGRGLMARWFHGCPGYAITIDRLNEFDFTLPYLDGIATFTVIPGNPSGFDPDSDDYSDFTIVHLSGAPTNEPCLRRLKKRFGKVLIAQDLPEAKAVLLNRTADVLFSPRRKIDGLETLPARFRCDINGAGIMLKKGSNVATWWDPAFTKFYSSGAYAKLCVEASEKYKANISCLNSLSEAQKLHPYQSPPQSSAEPDKLWTFVVSGRIAPYSYLNDEGRLVGFTKDFLDRVCTKAGKRCTLLLAEVSECTVRKGELLYPGRGLLEGWFDACTGYFDTYDRDNSWDFTLPYLVSYASFYVAIGNPSRFNPDLDDYSKYTIVYAETAITNAHCLNRLHKKYGKLVVVPDRSDAINMLLNRTADAWFTKDDGAPAIEKLPQQLHCENVGTSIMTKKGGELPLWWNKVFQEFYTSGEYNAFCREKGREFQTKFPCLPEPTWSVQQQGL
ncbi:uncharacterized protein LOC106072884 isoform X1 [Biomphalaria glabrata]|uniref:Uncharacterized protein LOC106072884 isoform X1 n=2 Tax=Biomphalaria glabrata TaxID=6526 RepID=A0A9W3AG24_BIOGL|nr:uncharacterized protein LOC106072884 isoform X1 [Biomphalaria glabrata]